ncbi:MAG: bifunctional nuclease family protein [Mycobacterium leprae]
MIRLNLLNVGVVEDTEAILLVLQAPEQKRLLVIETGPLEGEAVALEAEGIRAERPLTQDLFYEALERLGATVVEVQIYDFRDETFFARILLNRAENDTPVELDARPSDAIALALRARCPIYVSDNVLAEVGIPERRSGRFAELFTDEPLRGRVVH